MKDTDPQTYAIIGAAMEVHRELGAGFYEPVYQAALAIELETRGIPFRAEVHLPVFYKDKELTPYYRADFICYENIMIESKAISDLSHAEESQLLNAMKATRTCTRGLLLNFGHPSLQYERRVYDLANPQPSSRYNPDDADLQG